MSFAVQGQDLAWMPWEVPPPGPGEVRIEVAAAGVNRADLMQATGRYPPPAGASPILGLEVAGVVESMGPGVDHLRPGDRVAALLAGGGYATYAVCPAHQLLRVPSPLSDVEAASWPEALATVQLSVRREGALAAGDRVLVHAGASGVGLAAVQVLTQLGHDVFVTVGTQEKLDHARSLGAVAGAVRTDGQWAPTAAAWAGELGFQVILDPVGGAYLEQDQAVLGVGGRIVVIGLLGGRRAEVDLARLLLRHQRLIGTTLRSRPEPMKAEILAEVRADLWPMALDGRLRPQIFATLPLTRAREAHALLASDATIGKVVLTAP